MRRPVNTIASGLFAIICFLTPIAASVVGDGSSKYSKPDFGFVATVPDDWHVYAEREDEGRFIVSFGLPMVWSESEKKRIENDVSITVYHRIDISSLKKVVEYEERRVADMLVSRKEVTSTFGKAFVIVTKIHGFEYKTLSTCHFVNGFGYVISFTATEGTYDINLKKYSDFLAALVFVPVDEKKL
jgi:hypothetical protein